MSYLFEFFPSSLSHRYGREADSSQEDGSLLASDNLDLPSLPPEVVFHSRPTCKIIEHHTVGHCEAVVETAQFSPDNRPYRVVVFRDGELLYEQFESEWDEALRTAGAYLDWQRDQDS
jgi:hypothetical protein